MIQSRDSIAFVAQDACDESQRGEVWWESLPVLVTKPASKAGNGVHVECFTTAFTSGAVST